MAEDKDKKADEDAKDEATEAETSTDEAEEASAENDEAAEEESEGAAEDESADDDAEEDESSEEEPAAAKAKEPVVPPKSSKKKKKKPAKKKPADQAIKAKPEEKASKSANGKREFVRWPVDKDHKSSIDLLTGQGAEQDIDLSEDPDVKGPGAMNFVLLLLITAVAVVGVWQFYTLSSAEALAAKRQEREAVEKKHLEEQLAKQKKYGVIRIESSPAQADIYRDGVKMVTTKPDTGEEIVVQTPANMMNMEVKLAYKFKVEKAGHEPFEFTVAEHLWTKDSGSGEYKFVKMIELTPNVCDYWFLYDAKKRREVQFKDPPPPKDPAKKPATDIVMGKDACQTYYDEAVSAGTSVTECTCKLPPEGVNPEEKGADK